MGASKGGGSGMSSKRGGSGVPRSDRRGDRSAQRGGDNGGQSIRRRRQFVRDEYDSYEDDDDYMDGEADGPRFQYDGLSGGHSGGELYRGGGDPYGMLHEPHAYNGMQHMQHAQHGNGAFGGSLAGERAVGAYSQYRGQLEASVSHFEVCCSLTHSPARVARRTVDNSK